METAQEFNTAIRNSQTPGARAAADRIATLVFHMMTHLPSHPDEAAAINAELHALMNRVRAIALNN